jgi:uncharacterized protein (DUF433 family)
MPERRRHRLSQSRIAAAIADSGVYTVPVAARLLHERPATVERWAFGYQRRGKDYPAAIITDIPPIGDSRVITFLELVELMFVQALLTTGLSWPKVREASRVAAHLLKDERHPFATRRWFADPAALYLSLGQEHDEDLLIEVAGHAQVAMEPVLHPYLKQLDFDSRGVARRWFPMGLEAAVVLDPRRSFGMPITVSAGVPTDTLARLSAAGDTVETIAAWYRMDEAEVDAALRYEEGLTFAA